MTATVAATAQLPDTDGNLLTVEEYAALPPELAVEIRSPDDSLSRMTGKAIEYLGAGVDMVWLIDPLVKTVRVMRTVDETPGVLRPTDTLRLDDVLPGFEVSVAAFFED